MGPWLYGKLMEASLPSKSARDGRVDLQDRASVKCMNPKPYTRLLTTAVIFVRCTCGFMNITFAFTTRDTYPIVKCSLIHWWSKRWLPDHMSGAPHSKKQNTTCVYPITKRLYSMISMNHTCAFSPPVSYSIQRRFRSETSDNMESWKSRAEQ